MYYNVSSFSLYQDVPVPIFMNKAQDEWTDEDKKAFVDYEKKCKELNEEREKYKKVGLVVAFCLQGVPY